ncbi:HlyD family secretion protein [Undibacterium luofuense]|uniref:HlyD family efflux transporter periplasmic adaptor subunit n=1 Tax=Undibacterium luofuense TaxID=2828733 RepID=A0A941DQR7_9BURK|nr:HlyD family efflux transporter periplasmic adaptor subunit [Undibacterium luofuense]MBR7784220.1 HlyD family efflux transporter periplasmic adaptor subunit [Undibacterium luofuense]
MQEKSILFRSEVAESQGQQWMGSIHLAQPISGWIIVIITTLITVGLIAFICFGDVSKKARIVGITSPKGGSVVVVAANAGIIKRQFIKEGEVVQPGQVLFELAMERNNGQGELSELIAKQLEFRQQSLEVEQKQRILQTNQKKQAILLHLSNLETELSQLDQEISLAHRRRLLADESLSKFQKLQDGGYVSDAQSQQKQEELIDIDVRLSSLKRNKLQLTANQLAIKAEYNDLTNSLVNDQAQLDRSIASLKQEIAENINRKTNFITASEAGVVVTINFQLGQAVAVGQSLATLIPQQAELEAQLYAPSHAAGFISPGQNVLIRYQAFPYQKFGLQKGTVVDISKTPLAPSELPPNIASTILSNAQQNIQGFNGNEALYRIRVKLEKQNIQTYGHKQVLKPGMTLEADVLQDSRKIWEWILEPALAVANRIN